MAKGQNRESVTLALETLRANKLRSGLTILGIVIGVTTVITISSVINGVNRRVSDWITSLGSNVLWVFHMPLIGVNPTTEMLTRRKLNLDDVLALCAACRTYWLSTAKYQPRQPAVPRGRCQREIQRQKSRGRLHHGFDRRARNDLGTSSPRKAAFGPTRKTSAMRTSVMLGHDTAEDLFGTEDPIGKDVNVATGLYTVIGVVDKRKQPFGSGKNPADNGVYFPLGTFHNLYPEIKDMYIGVKYDDQKYKSLVTEEVRESAAHPPQGAS
jgi:putative ABC transport system permease protein